MVNKMSALRSPYTFYINKISNNDLSSSKESYIPGHGCDHELTQKSLGSGCSLEGFRPSE